MVRDFISTPYPEDMEDDEEIDVIIMDFALEDFREFAASSIRTSPIVLSHLPISLRNRNGGGWPALLSRQQA